MPHGKRGHPLESPAATCRGTAPSGCDWDWSGAVFRLRRSFRELFREEIAQTVATRADVDEELRYLVEPMTTGVAAAGIAVILRSGMLETAIGQHDGVITRRFELHQNRQPEAMF